MTRLAAVALLLAACGGSGRPPSPDLPEGMLDEAAGTQIVLVPRSTSGRVWLSLWLDAGSRDADPPELATLAMWTAVSADDVAVRVLPDGIELTLPCRTPALHECLSQLAAAVGQRRLDPERWSAAERRLEDARARIAGDEGRRLDALALEALLGRSIDPLGRAAEPADIEAAEQFLADHAGAGRLLLVAIGDVDARALREAVEVTLGRLPRARRSRAVREAHGARSVRVEVGDREAVAAATLRPSIADGARLARRWLARVEGDVPRARATADTFPVRGGAAVVARVEGREAQRALVEHLAELSEEPALQASDPPPSEDGPRALARWIGVRWASRQREAVRAGLGVAVLLDGGRGDRVGEADPDAALRDAAERELTHVLRATLDPVTLEGTVSADLVDARLPGGAVLRARRLAGAARLSAVVLFEGGAEEEPADEHGVTALLTRLAAEGCDEVSRRELGLTLESLGIETAAILTAEAWGLRVEGPPDRWREVSYLAPRCAGLPYLDTGEVGATRETLMATLTRPEHAGRALVATLLSPAAPGRVAPLGSAHGVDAVSPRVLARARRQRVARVRARLALAGDVAMDDAARILARGAARWDEGAAPELAPWAASTEPMRGGRHPYDRYEAVVAWTTTAPDQGDMAAAAFAQAAARALSGEPGLRALWHEGGTHGGRAFALVGLETSPDALDGLPAHVSRAVGTLGWSEVADVAVADDEERRAWGESSPRRVALALATRSAEPLARDEAIRILEQLASSSPYYVILRPQPRRR